MNQESKSQLRNYNDLSAAEKKELLKCYDEGVKIREIISTFKLNVGPGSLTKLLPPKEISKKCKYCNVPLLTNRVRDPSNKRDPRCPKCGHIEYPKISYPFEYPFDDFLDISKKCYCENCMLAEYDDLQKLRTQLEKEFPRPEEPISESELSPQDLAKLLFLIEIMGKKKVRYYVSSKFMRIFVNDDAVYKRYIDEFINANILYLDVKKTSISGFDLNTLPIQYNINDAVFGVNVIFSKNTARMLDNNDHYMYAVSGDCKRIILRDFMLSSLRRNLRYLMGIRGFEHVHFDAGLFNKLLYKTDYKSILSLQYTLAEHSLYLHNVRHASKTFISDSISTMIYHDFNNFEKDRWIVSSKSSREIDTLLETLVTVVFHDDIEILDNKLGDIFKK